MCSGCLPEKKCNYFLQSCYFRGILLVQSVYVSDGPRSVRITLSDDRRYSQCTADSNPPADYSWMSSDRGHVHQGQQLDLCLIDIEVVKQLLCEARNSVTNLTATAAFDINATLRTDIVNTCSKSFIADKELLFYLTASAFTPSTGFRNFLVTFFTVHRQNLQ